MPPPFSVVHEAVFPAVKHIPAQLTSHSIYPYRFYLLSCRTTFFQVDVVVEIRSDSGEFQYVGPHLKVAYRRTPLIGRGDENERRDVGTTSRRPLRAAEMNNGLGMSADDEPNVSYR